MNYRLTHEQELFVQGVRNLMERENWEPYFAECDDSNTYPERFVKELANMGLDSLLLPEEHDGFDAGLLTLTVIWEELGRLGAPTYVLYQMAGFSTFLREGSEEQINKILALRGTGKQMWNSAITEPGAGSDVRSLQTSYLRKNGKIYLNGTKCYITSAAGAAYLVVMAKDASSMTPVFSEFFVDMNKPGITVTPLPKLGLKMDSCCEVEFDQVELEESDLFGTEGNGFERVKEEFDLERFLIACTNYGSAYCAFEDAARYANHRVQFGQPIARTQLIQDKFAQMAINLNNMKNMLYQTAWKADNGMMTSGDAAMCKLYCAKAAFEVVDEAMQVFGGSAITGEHRISRFWRDLRVDRVSGGSEEMQRLTLGRAVLKEYA
ncbi:crotonobetainyl-CoA dehydrogenase [Ferrimonas sediminum]|uniref:Crotonobetainyl-CoA dehydrogenase n=1 Tax=Ferrimonas sediminum TaxID=718193 RepID=A0A1G8PTM1_9GAMM|nr:crotonobetainyl-CoA dehydrogenase [Ferrimonas sediminum]SDI95220.1 crotonobetainyl-CoA dehydrogenase [Ferrimonas sediminum]